MIIRILIVGDDLEPLTPVDRVIDVGRTRTLNRVIVVSRSDNGSITLQVEMPAVAIPPIAIGRYEFVQLLAGVDVE